MLKLKLQYFGHLMQRTDSLEETLMLGRQEEKRMTEVEMVDWHHWLDGHEFGQAPGVVMDRKAWHAAVHGAAKSRARPSDWSDWTDSVNCLSQVTLVIKNPAVNAGDIRDVSWVPSLGRDYPLEENVATHASSLASRIPWTVEPGRLYNPLGRKESDTTEVT